MGLYVGVHSGQMQKCMSHPVAKAFKIPISSTRLQSEVRKKMIEIQ